MTICFSIFADHQIRHQPAMGSQPGDCRQLPNPSSWGLSGYAGLAYSLYHGPVYARTVNLGDKCQTNTEHFNQFFYHPSHDTSV